MSREGVRTKETQDLKSGGGQPSGMQPREAWPEGSAPRGPIIREVESHTSPWEAERWTHLRSPHAASAREAAASEHLQFTQHGASAQHPPRHPR